MTAPNRNELWARVLLDELARAGVREIVVSPGSRSAPLVLAAAEDSRLQIHLQIDERSAGFVALGVGKFGGAPAAVITTSGTAVANLLPAVVEAAQAEVPLILLTADRPPKLRGGDANQTIDQVKLFGGYLRRFEELSPAEASEGALRHLRSAAARAVRAALGDPAGPVHLNLAFDTPLEPVLLPGDLPEPLAEGTTSASRGRDADAPWTRVLPLRAPPSPEGLALAEEALRRARRPLIIAGPLPRPTESGAALRRAAAAWGIPLLADPLSGARYPAKGEAASEGVTVIGGYDLALREPRVREALRPDLILRVGGAPTSATLADWLLGLEGTPHLLVDGGGRWKDHAGTATDFIPADPGGFMEALADRTGARTVAPKWTRAWLAAEGAVRREVGEFSEPFEGGAVAAAARALEEDALLFVSNSMPIRDLDAFLPHHPLPLTAFGNRGASGIDGIVSTAAGISLASGRRVVVLLGDLALLHDSNGLASLRDPRVRVTLLVLNNDGGGIFHFLGIRRHEPAFTPYFATPHGREPVHLATFHGLEHVQADGIAGLADGMRRLLALEGSGVLELRSDREENRRVRTEVADRVAAAAARALTQDE